MNIFYETLFVGFVSLNMKILLQSRIKNTIYIASFYKFLM